MSALLIAHDVSFLVFMYRFIHIFSSGTHLMRHFSRAISRLNLRVLPLSVDFLFSKIEVALMQTASLRASKQRALQKSAAAALGEKFSVRILKRHGCFHQLVMKTELSTERAGPQQNPQSDRSAQCCFRNRHVPPASPTASNA